MEAAGFIIIIGVLFSFGAWLWYYTSIGKSINIEEKSKEKNEINPFTGSARDINKTEK